MSPPSREQINRWLIGGLSAVSLFLWLLLLTTGWGTDLWTGSFLRSGLLLGAFWLALPTRGRAAAWAGISPWWIVVGSAALFFVVKSPLVALPALGAALAVLAVLNALIGRSRRQR